MKYKRINLDMNVKENSNLFHMGTNWDEQVIHSLLCT